MLLLADAANQKASLYRNGDWSAGPEKRFCNHWMLKFHLHSYAVRVLSRHHSEVVVLAFVKCSVYFTTHFRLSLSCNIPQSKQSRPKFVSVHTTPHTTYIWFRKVQDVGSACPPTDRVLFHGRTTHLATEALLPPGHVFGTLVRRRH